MRLAIGLVATLALVGCTPEESPTPSPSPSAELQSPAPSPSPSPAVESPSPSPSPTAFQSYPGDLPTEDPVSAAIIHGWQEYPRVYEKFATAPNAYSDLSETQHVTWGHESTVILDRIDALRDQGLELVGGRRFSDMQLGQISSNAEGLRAVQLTYCLDISQMQVREVESGELVERSGAYKENAWLVEGPDGLWRVEGLNTLDEPC